MRQHQPIIVRVFLTASLLTILASGVTASQQQLDPSGPAQARVEVVSDNHGETILEFHMGSALVDSQLSGGDQWTTVSMPGMVAASRSGWPEIPQLSVWLETGDEHPELTILESDTLIRNWGPILPAAEPQDRSSLAQPRRMPAPEFYSGAALYPTQPAVVSLSGNLALAHVILVTFSPIQFEPRSSAWIIHTRIRVRLSHTGGGSLDQNIDLPEPLRQLVRKTVINPGDAQADSSSSPKLLLVTETSLLSALQPFIAWKLQIGIPVMTLLYPQEANNALSLRTRIRHICDSLSPPPGFLLIVGDVDSIPAFYGVDNSLTDHPYSLLTDTDYLPDLSVGRIPCQSAADCEVWVNRLLAYERDATLPHNFTGFITSSASGVDSLHGVYVTSLFQTAGMTAVDHFQTPTSATLPLVLSSLNTGREWVFYIGHGNAQAWTSIAPSLTNSNLDQDTSQVAPIVVSVACATAKLDFPGESFAEYWLALPGDRGPLAYFGATENTAFYRSDTIGIGALRAVFLQDCERLGTAADYGRLATAQCFPQAPGGLTEETIQQFELLGDPSMRVFSAPPESLSVTAPASISRSASTLSLAVQRGASPLGGALVCLMSDTGGLYRIRSTDSLGQAVIPVSLGGVSWLTLTVTAHNAVPYSRDIAVVSETSANVLLGETRVLDSAGDNDGLADRSESCVVQLSLFNPGTAASLSGVVHVSCADGRITLGATSASFPRIAPYDTLWLEQSFPFSVSDSVNDLDVAMLRVSVINRDGDSSTYARPLVLHAPRLIFAGSALLEDSGDGDGNPEAGERLALQLRFANIGSDHAVSPTCSFTSSSSVVHLLDVEATRRIVLSGDTLIALMHLRADTGIARGFEFDYGYQISAANVPPQSGVGTARIGQVPVFLFELDPAPEQIDAVADALTCLGVEHERSQTLPFDLSLYASVWIFCGIFPNQISLSESDGAQIAQYLDGGGNCYWEGGDVWAYDPVTALHPYFHIQGTQDGTSDAGPVQGAAGTLFSAYHFAYSGENSFIDRLAPEDSAMTLLRNVRAGAVYPLCIAYAGPTYRTIGCSIELGSLVDASFPSTRVHLFKDMLDWFGIQSRADIYPPVIRTAPLRRLPGTVPTLTFLADIQDASGVSSAELHYQVGDGALLTTSMVLAHGLYGTTISRPPDSANLFFSISATDNSPTHNTATTPETLLEFSSAADVFLSEDFGEASREELSDRVTAPEGCSWSLTKYPEKVPVLELHAKPGSSVSYETKIFDCSRLQNPIFSFWQYLRETGESINLLARVTGSTDSGRTFSYNVWEYSQKGGGVLEESTVASSSLEWMRGQSFVVLRFEFFGSGYWRLNGIKITDNPAPETMAVQDLVISVVRSDGIQLNWNRAPGAARYAVCGSASSHINGEFVELARTSDTTWTDWDDRFSARYYQVIALTSANASASNAKSANIAIPSQPTLRLPDLKWNRKLQAVAPKPPSVR